MKIRFLLITIFFVIGATIIYFITEPKVEKWIYELPNDYVIKKTSETNIVLGKNINNSFKIKSDNKKIGIEEYIAEFSYSDNFISLKCLEANSLKVKFYIIDSKNSNIYGPYYDEETYKTVLDEIVDEKLSEWIETIKTPKGAVNK